MTPPTATKRSIIHASEVISIPNVYNLNDFQKLAKHKLPCALYEYLASGTDNEQTIVENRIGYFRWYLRPRVMRPVGKLQTKINLFGRQLSMPVFVSPAGVHALCDPINGECATAKACGEAGILFGLSQHATRSIEQVATAAPETNKWYQSYILKDRSMTLRLVKRAVAAGYKGIFLTVDSVRFGYREADARNGFNALPPPHRLVNYDEPTNTDNQSNDTNNNELSNTYNSKTKQAWDQNSEQMFEQNVTWDDVRWLKDNGCPNLPLVVKGIMTGEDAMLAIQAGADGIMVSNHGGRQLDGAMATIDVLPEIVDAVNGRVPIFLDSGIRRGTDVVKALALGATAVGLGKPIFFALSVGGQNAVRQLFDMLRTEIEAAMAICGCETIADITSSLVTRHPTATTQSYMLRAAL